MRFSVTFCALLLVTTTGIAQADSRDLVKTAGNNRADLSENATSALGALGDLNGGLWQYFGFFLEKGEGGRGVAIAKKTARENKIRRSNDSENPGQIATGHKGSVQLFVETPNGISQSVMASRVLGNGRAEVTYFNLDPITHKLLSATVCYYDRPCLTITKKSCDSVFPKSSNFEQNLNKIWECGRLLRDLEKIHDPIAEIFNLGKIREIRPGMKLSPSNIIPHVRHRQIVDQSSEDMSEIAYKYHVLARAISFCRRAGSFERFEDPRKVLNSQSQNKSPGSAEAATQ